MPACRRNDRDLPSWPCEFDSRHPLHSIAPNQLTFSAPKLFEHPGDTFGCSPSRRSHDLFGWSDRTADLRRGADVLLALVDSTN